MQNFVTFETAHRLEGAGFPQPEPEFGQIWYDSHGRKFVVTTPEGANGEIYKLVGGLFGNQFWFCGSLKSLLNISGDKGWVFAPNASDILEQLNTGPQEQDGWYLGDGFVGEYEQYEGFGRTQGHENPAEACAAAWLSVHQPIAA